MAKGGDIIEITYTHPELGNGQFYPKSAEDSTFDLGGFRSEDDANGIAGNGNMIDKMNRVRWMFEVTVEWNTDTDDLERAEQLASSPNAAQWTMTSINGSVYQGVGKIVGDVAGKGNASTFPLKVSGGGALTKIVG